METRPMRKSFADRITNYYNECYLYYKIFWRSHQNLCLHYGFHDKGQGHNKALIRMIEVLSGKAGITSKEKVLDAGSGVGGSAIWLAQHIGCQVVGIDINPNFINIARREAKKRKLDDLVSFHEMNFCQTSFRENDFDTVWAVESSCHAEDKQAFLMEMSRILKPGGHIVIADAYQTRESPELDHALMNWAVPNIPSIADFTNYLTRAGFRQVVCEDISDKVLPSSLLIYRLAWIGYPLVIFLRLLKLKTDLSMHNSQLALHQYRYANKGLGKYCIFIAEKTV